MLGYLLDTNVVLRLAFQRETLGVRLLEMLATEPLYISQVCALEMAIKTSIGKLPLPPPFSTNFAIGFSEMARELKAGVLAIDLGHIDTLSHLPLHHRDPFDRLIIAQALTEELTLVSSDRVFASYPGLKVLGA